MAYQSSGSWAPFFIACAVITGVLGWAVIEGLVWAWDWFVHALVAANMPEGVTVTDTVPDNCAR